MILPSLASKLTKNARPVEVEPTPRNHTSSLSFELQAYLLEYWPSFKALSMGLIPSRRERRSGKHCARRVCQRYVGAVQPEPEKGPGRNDQLIVMATGMPEVLPVGASSCP